MRTLDVELQNALGNNSPAYYKRVYLYRRTWTGTAYVDDTVIDISDYVLEISPIKWKLDKEGYGEWTLDNATLTLSNGKNEFKQGNTDGFFGANKIFFKSKIVIKAGVKFDDGTESIDYVFTGFVSEEPDYQTSDRKVSVAISGHMALFSEISAEAVSTASLNWLAGSDSGTVFTTTDFGVSEDITVKKGTTTAGPSAATELLPDKDYSVSQTNDIALGAKVTLVQALLSGQSLWVSYKYWYQNKTIEWVVGQVCAAAGITSISISPATFSNDVRNVFSAVDKTDFDLGTYVNTECYNDDVRVADPGYYTPFNTWAITENPHNATLTQADGSAGLDLGVGGSNGWHTIRNDQTNANGVWIFRGYDFTFKYLHFISDTGDRTTTSGYALEYTGVAHYPFKLWRYDAGAATLLWTCPKVSFTYPIFKVRISRDTNNTFRIYLNEYNSPADSWGIYGTIADATHTTSTYVIATMNYTGGLSPGAALIKIEGWTATYEAYYLSPVIDGTASLTYWGKLTMSQYIPSDETYKTEVREGDDGTTWGAWQEVGSSGDMGVTKRYAQLKWSSIYCYGGTLGEWEVDYYSSQITIPLVDMSGLTCMDALEQLAGMCCYEMGFDSNDIFFFRPRTNTLSAVAVLNKNNIAEVSNVTDGVDRVYNSVKVSFGGYEKICDSVSEAETPPTSVDKYGTKELEISSSNFLPAANVDLAYAIAPTVYDYTAEPRRRAAVVAKYNMTLELGDKVSVKFEEPDVWRAWLWGDPDIIYGMSDVVYYDEDYAYGKLSLFGLDMRIEGVEFDLEAWTTTYDLVEVL